MSRTISKPLIYIQNPAGVYMLTAGEPTEPDLLCSIYHSLQSFVQVSGVYGNPFLIDTSGRSSPGKRKKLARLKRRFEDDSTGIWPLEKRGVGSRLLESNRVPVCGKKDDEFEQIRCMTMAEGESCILSILGLYRLSPLGTLSESVNAIFRHWLSVELDYDSFIYLLDSCNALSLWALMDQLLLTETVCIFLVKEMQKMEKMEKRSLVLSSLMDIYRVMVRLMDKVQIRCVQRKFTELIFIAFETTCNVMRSFQLWHRFALCLCRVIVKTCFSKSSYMHDQIISMCTIKQ